MEPLYHYPKKLLFITEDNYCFLIDDLVNIIRAQNNLYNPYTNQQLSENDAARLMNIPKITKSFHGIKIKQQYCAKKITPDTIEELKQLAEGLLNEDEITNGRGFAVPISQKAYEKFNNYYQSLDEREREALNNYWIDGWSFVFLSQGMISGKNPVKFEDLYQSINASCVHSIGGSIVKMVLQLDPNATFNPTSFEVKQVIGSIKKGTNFDSEYVTGKQQNRL